MFNRYRPIQIAYFFLYDFWQIVSFKKLVCFILIIKFMGIELFTLSFYFPFHVCRNYSDVLSFISEINNLYFLFFFP